MPPYDPTRQLVNCTGAPLTFYVDGKAVKTLPDEHKVWTSPAAPWPQPPPLCLEEGEIPVVRSDIMRSVIRGLEGVPPSATIIVTGFIGEEMMAIDPHYWEGRVLAIDRSPEGSVWKNGEFRGCTRLIACN